MKELEYKHAFQVVGYELDSSDALPEARVFEAESRLACEIPLALRSFYLVAGRARSVLNACDCFLLPEVWRREGNKLVFLTSADDFEMFAIDTTTPDEDPPVFRRPEDNPDKWTKVCDQSSEFLVAMVLWQGTFGHAMPYSATGYSHNRIYETLETRYEPVGGVTGMWAYGKPGLAICLDTREGNWQVHVGASDAILLEEVESLDVTWERYG